MTTNLKPVNRDHDPRDVMNIERRLRCIVRCVCSDNMAVNHTELH